MELIMNFIGKLLLLSSSNIILVIVDQLFKQAIFVPMVDTITLYDLAKLLMIHIFLKHGVLSHIICNQRSESVLNFFQSLGTILNMQLHFISRYYFEKNSQIEHTNQILEQYLCIYCKYQQDNWWDFLSLAKFIYNNTLSTTTSISLFVMNKSYYLNINVYLECDITFFCICKFAIDLNDFQTTLKMEISAM